MTRVLVTGADGFIARHLILALKKNRDLEVVPITRKDSLATLAKQAVDIDIAFHLAGVNRSTIETEFHDTNVSFTHSLLEVLESQSHKKPPVVFSSSKLAGQNTPYGLTKLEAEKLIAKYAEANCTSAYIYRLTNVFGAGCRPKYNSAVATFCHNLTRGLPIDVHEPSRQLELVWVGDVVNQFLTHLDKDLPSGVHALDARPTYTIQLQELAERLRAFADMRKTGLVPNLGDRFTKLLHSVLVSYYPTNDLAYPISLREDDRGWLFELIRSNHSGQIFVSSTKPGIERGNHFHEVKIEKFCVIQGSAVVKLRDKDGADVETYRIDGSPSRIIDIPPFHTHKIVNVGTDDLITIFWASEPFDPKNPDTYPEAVDHDA